MTRDQARRELLERAHEVAAQFVSSLAVGLLSGRSGQTSGSVLTRLSGSSIEFHEHRPYQPGDDLRHLDWRASARSGQHFVKLFREEIHPSVDLVIDVSASMSVDPEKARRAWELVYVVFEISKQDRASFRFIRPGIDSLPRPSDVLEHHDPELLVESTTTLLNPDVVSTLRMRRGAMKILVSDLLLPGDPTPFVSLFQAPAMFLVPSSENERTPKWRGNVALVDCESGVRRKQFVSDELIEKYMQAYKRHFDMWSNATRKQRVHLLEVPSEGSLATSLRSLVEGSPLAAWGY